MAKEAFTILIVPERSSRVRRLQFPRHVLTIIYSVGVLLVGLFSALTVHYFWVIDQAYQTRRLVADNVQLRQELDDAKTKLEGVNDALQRVDVLDRKLREITRLSDPARGLAIGPVQEPVAVGGGADLGAGLFAAPPAEEDPARERLEFALLDARIYGLAAEARRQELSLRELARYFDQQSALLSNTPSIWPVRGWVTSEFGMRDDPYTGVRTMHHGLDISTAEGKPVMSPANGTVVFAGNRGNYGNVLIIDHNLDVITFFAHLKDGSILVKPGDKVERGQHIAAVGNTGRSTGPHLHYEVRTHNIPSNPYTYILEASEAMAVAALGGPNE